MDTFGQSMPSMLSTAGGVLAAIVAAGLGYSWWRRRQAQRSRYDRIREMLLAAGFSASAEMPKIIGKAAAQSRSPWLPFLILPIALWLRERGKAGAQASVQMLEPLDLESRSQRLAPGRRPPRRLQPPLDSAGRSVGTARLGLVAVPAHRGVGWRSVPGVSLGLAALALVRVLQERQR